MEFGALMERNAQVAVDVGGVLVPGPGFTTPFRAGKEEYRYGRTREVDREGAGRGAQEGARGAQTQAAPRAASHAVGLVDPLRDNWWGNDITNAELEELETIYPDIRIVSSSSRLVYLGLTVRPFPSLSDGARLILEVPKPQYARAVRLPSEINFNDLVATSRLPWRPLAACLWQSLLLVPAVRAWARWVGGAAHGMSVLSHHLQPDDSICACMPYQWVRGINPLVDYIGMCVTWFARVIHERDIGVYPGRQHYPEWSRIKRDRQTEFCGCGSAERYSDCHRSRDRRIPAARLMADRNAVREAYFMELLRQRRPAAPPSEAWRELVK